MLYMIIYASKTPAYFSFFHVVSISANFSTNLAQTSSISGVFLLGHNDDGLSGVNVLGAGLRVANYHYREVDVVEISLQKAGFGPGKSSERNYPFIVPQDCVTVLTVN